MPRVVGAASGSENLLLPLPPQHWGEPNAVHLLRRAGFEGTSAEIRRFCAMTLEQAVDQLIGDAQLPPPTAEPLIDPKLSEPPPRIWLHHQEEETLRRYRRTRRAADRLQLDRVRNWWLDRMITSPRQLQEKMTLFWHGHFTSGYREVGSSVLLFRQNQLFREYALGNYRQLLLKVSADPAMLVYLDSARNHRRQPNENYARELLELFTLGEGHYGESDIKAAARAFTGWSIEDGHFKFRSRQHDYDDKLFLGRIGPWNGDDIVDLLLQKEQASRFIVTRLWEFFCYPDPERSVVSGLAHLLRKKNDELAPVVRKILLSRGFYSARSRGTQIKSPVQLAVGTLRLLDVQACDGVALAEALRAMGQELFQPPNVKGWDGGPKWINTATLYNRYNFAGAVVGGHKARPRRGLMMRMKQDADEFGFMQPPPRPRLGLPPYDPDPLVRGSNLTTAEEVVDFFAARLLAVPLPAGQRDRLVAFASQGQPFDLRQNRARRRVRTLIHLLMSTPEYQLY